MFVLADIIRLAATAPERLVAHGADVVGRPGGFVWRVRRRSPAFQRAVSLLVEASTEALLGAWAVAMLGAPGPWVDVVLPAWLVAQGVALALVLTWEGRGRVTVRVVRLGATELAVGRRVVPLDAIEDVRMRSGGWGPWRTAEVTVQPRGDERVRFAADGDDDASLRRIVDRIDGARERARQVA